MSNQTMFLEPEEIAMLTGRKFKSRQIDALRRMGVAFFVNATGHAVVTRTAIEGKAKTTALKKEWVSNMMKVA